jgi:hypothetical protein
MINIEQITGTTEPYLIDALRAFDGRSINDCKKQKIALLGVLPPLVSFKLTTLLNELYDVSADDCFTLREAYRLLGNPVPDQGSLERVRECLADFKRLHTTWQEHATATEGSAEHHVALDQANTWQAVVEALEDALR